MHPEKVSRSLIRSKYVFKRVAGEPKAKGVDEEASVQVRQLDQPVGIADYPGNLVRFAGNVASNHYWQSRIRSRISPIDTSLGLNPSDPPKMVGVTDLLLALMLALADCRAGCRISGARRRRSNSWPAYI